MNAERFQKQLEFILEIDKMKTVLRQSLICGKTRQENDAEHSWHMAVMAVLLYEYAPSKDVNLLRVIKMILIHDLVEIYAGDTFCFDKKGNEDKELREKAAADQLFPMLPEDQASEFRALWEEFDTMQTIDSIYAAAIDRLQPFLLNYCNDGYTWSLLDDITSKEVFERLGKIKYGLPELWPVIVQMVESFIEKGILKK